MVAAAVSMLATLGGTQALAAPVSVGRSGWLWGDPSPQGETLNRVAFQGFRGYAVGEHGTVLRSDDGGRSWVGLASGTPSDLTLLQEIEPNTVVVGGGCTARESTDAGVTFHRLAVNASETSCATKIASLSFLTASTGYVEQTDGTILFTADGGQSVQQRTSVPLGGDGPVEIDFVSSSTGFAVVSGPEGGRIYRTTDGAGSWTQVGAAPFHEPLSSLAVVSPTIAYAVGGGNPKPVGVASLLMVSEDGGTSWAERDIVLPAGTPATTLSQISCSDPLHCVMATGTTALITTSDGGLTASPVTPSGQSLLSVAFSSGSDVVAVGAGGATVLSSDGGTTIPMAVSSRLPEAFSSEVRLGASAQDAYVAGHAGLIAETTDGGAEWGTLRVPTSQNIVDVAFPTVQVGYAIDAQGIVYRTADAGQTWAIEAAAGEPPSRLLAPNADTALLVGPTGLRRSTDGGAMFAPVGGSVVIGKRHGRLERRSLSAFPLFAGAELAGPAIIAWGDEAIESLDGGARWQLIPRPLGDGGVEAVSFLSPTTGYEISRQRLFFTRDSGRSWSEIASLGTEALGGESNLSFSSVEDGYFVGRFAGGRNVVMRTSDGGRSWTPELLPRNLAAIAAGGAVDYAAGEGALFETSDGGLSPTGSTLTLTIVGSRRVSSSKLRKELGRVRLKGRLSPAQGGETVIVSYRAAGRALWQHRKTTVSSSGSFSLTIGGISSSTDFVAQWSGEGPVSGAGTVAVALAVTRR
ncbi:MAG: WD40/YVTN/BNR-like repeat-containing protein [Solirubrobacteraceae bacterium]